MRVRRIDFRVDDDNWELAEIIAARYGVTVHQLAYQTLMQEIRMASEECEAFGESLRATIIKQRQRQPDGQRQR